MSKPIRRLAAEETWREALPVRDAQTAWLDAARAEAHARFAELGLPTPRTENWRWSDIHRYLNAPYAPLAEAPLDNDVLQALLQSHLLGVADASVMVFVNGRFSQQHSRIMEEEGVEILALSEAPVAIDWADIAADADDAVDLLNMAHVTDGALIRVRAGVDASIPLLIVNVAAGAQGHSVALRHFIRVEEGAHFTLFEAQLGGGDMVASQITRAIVHDDASLTRVQVNERDEAAILLAALKAEVGAHGALHDTALLTGGRYTRQNTQVAFTGDHAEATANAAYLLRGRQHADTRLKVLHTQPHCTSRETFRCVMDEHARGAFQGLIHVFPGAAKTDGEMSAHGLLLGEDAEFDSKPELEIYHDDVVCAHGSAVGALDEQQLFYLRARGVPERTARAMLVAAFVGEVFDAVDDERVREALTAFAERWLADGTKASGEAA